ncbi:MAG: M48 family metallopeptidase, partial [Pseudomonadota bacterium]
DDAAEQAATRLAAYFDERPTPCSAAVLEVGGPVADAGRRALLWLKEQARATLTDRAAWYADQLGAPFSKVSIRDTRSRWGSCSSAGALSFSWRLVMAPPRVLDYVAAHEVAHLREMNHSARFWAVVDGLKPDWRKDRAWLRAHGAGLHCYRLSTQSDAPLRANRSDLADCA